MIITRALLSLDPVYSLENSGFLSLTPRAGLIRVASHSLTGQSKEAEKLEINSSLLTF